MGKIFIIEQEKNEINSDLYREINSVDNDDEQKQQNARKKRANKAQNMISLYI